MSILRSLRIQGFENTGFPGLERGGNLSPIDEDGDHDQSGCSSWVECRVHPEIEADGRSKSHDYCTRPVSCDEWNNHSQSNECDSECEPAGVADQHYGRHATCEGWDDKVNHRLIPVRVLVFEPPCDITHESLLDRVVKCAVYKTIPSKINKAIEQKTTRRWFFVRATLGVAQSFILVLSGGERLVQNSNHHLHHLWLKEQWFHYFSFLLLMVYLLFYLLV